MAIKPFEIQGSTLTIGGVDLQAGTTGVVIPGVTQATNYFVEEVDSDDNDQTVLFEIAPVIIDHVTFTAYNNGGSYSLRATYTAELDDDGYIDEINVDTGGYYSSADRTINESQMMLAYSGPLTGEDMFIYWTTGDWTTIPFRPKMRAGEIENIGGSNANTGDITFEDNMIIGAGEDSGDGNGYNTIRLVPDYSLGENGQYIVIDPTAPNHIHIRAGGEQDNSPALLILGGEKNHVVVEDGNGVTISNEQTFDSINYYSAGPDFTDFTWFEENGNYFVQFTIVAAPMISDFWNFTNGAPNALRVYDSQGQYTLTYGGTGSNIVANVYKVQVVEAPIADFVATALEFQIFTTNYNEMYLRNNDFRVDVKDDVRIIGNDVFRLTNRSADEPIEIITNDDNQSYTWYFGADGSLTFPDATVQTTAYTGDSYTDTDAREAISIASTGTTYTRANDYGDLSLTGFYQEGYGFEYFGAQSLGWADVNKYNNLTNQPNGTVFTITFGVSETYTFTSTSGSGTGNGFYGTWSPTPSRTINNETITSITFGATATPLSYDNTTGEFSFDASLLGNSLTTVAKTGSGAPATGEVATVTLSPTNNTNFTPGTYPGIFIGLNAGFSITLVVAENGDLSATVISSGSGFVVGDQGSVNGAAIAGGTTSVDDFFISVASLTNIAYPTALDLTKQVQKLTDGWYTLADGVEGQIMHLVASSNLTDANSVTVVVANARIGTNVGTDYWLYPFNALNQGVHGFSTVIFVDGAWQANGGQWD